MRQYYVYIITNYRKTVLYTGVTNNLSKRLDEHAYADNKSFTGRYRVRYLLYAEQYISIHVAISREKEIKSWTRRKKVALIRTLNPEFKALDPVAIVGW